MVCTVCEQALCGIRSGWNLVPQRTCSPAKVCKVIDIAVPRDYLTDDKEVQKEEKCHDLKQLLHLALSQKRRYMDTPTRNKSKERRQHY